MAQQRAAQIAGHLAPQGLLAGQVAIITGSGQGIGAEAARLFAQEGAKVVVQDIDDGTIAPRYIPQYRINADPRFALQPKLDPSSTKSSKPAGPPSLYRVTC